MFAKYFTSGHPLVKYSSNIKAEVFQTSKRASQAKPPQGIQHKNSYMINETRHLEKAFPNKSP